jgi:YD repeat-containing protein
LPTASSTALVVQQVVENDYNSRGLKTAVKVKTPTTLERLTQYSYDASNRLKCVAKRMAPATFTTPISDACALGTVSSFGADRITYHRYDTLSRPTKTISGYGTSDAGIDIELSYSANGQVDSRKDGNGNATHYSYDGIDRLHQTTFADDSYEQQEYDDNGNVRTLRKRDGKVHTHAYDAINNTISTLVPAESTLT